MKKQLLMGSVTAAILLANAGSVLAEDAGNGFDVSANVGLVSDYVWRGISQSNNDAAIQGGIDVKHSSGAYLGTWWSSLSGYYNNPTSASTEKDLYVGYGFNVTKDISLDLRYTSFVYDGGNSANFDEFHVGVAGYGASLAADYAGNNSPGNSTTLHVAAGYTYTLPMDVSLSANYGHYDLKDNFFNGSSAYDYWNVGVSKKFAGITWGLSYNDTDLTGNECSALSGVITNPSSSGDAKQACGDQFILSATKAL